MLIRSRSFYFIFEMHMVIAQQALETVVDVRDLCIMCAASFGIVLILLLMQVVSHNKIVFHEKVGVLA